MKYFLIAFCIAFLGFSGAKDIIGPNGFKPATIKDFPSLATISYKDVFLTHGIILNSRVILMPNFEYEDMDKLRVRVGSNSWWKGGQNAAVYDVLQTRYFAFVILRRNLKFGDSVQPASFTKNTIPEVSSKIQLVAWRFPTADEEGDYELKKDNFGSLISESMVVVNQDQCGGFFSSAEENDFPFFCAKSSLDDLTYNRMGEIMPVFRNGDIEAFVWDLDNETGTVVLMQSPFIYEMLGKFISDIDGVLLEKSK